MGVLVVSQGNRHAVGLAGAGAFALAQVTAVGQAFDVVVMAVLGGAHLALKTQHLGPVLAKRAVHGRLACDHLVHPLDKGLDHLGLVPQVRGLDEADVAVVGGDPFGVLADAAHQHPRKEEIGKDDDPLEAQPHHVPQSRLHQREGHPRIHGFAPAEAEALDQHAGHLGHVRVGIGVRRAPSHHHQQGLVQRRGLAAGFAVVGIGLIKGLAHPGAGGLNHLQVDPQLTAVIDPQPRFGGKGVEHRRDVVFGMAGGEQHRRHRQHVFDPLLLQALETVAQDRPGKLEVAVLHRQGRQPPGHQGRQLGKFGHGQPVAAAMPADQHPDRAIGARAEQSRR